MTFEPEKRPQIQANVVTPRARTCARSIQTALPAAAAVVVLNRPPVADQTDALQIAHLDAVGDP